MDYIVRATAAEGQIRAFAATTKDTVEFARQTHNTSPVMTAALGRLLTAGGMMGVMMKGDDLLTLQIRGDGPAHGLTVTADANGNVKGLVDVPDVILPARADHKLDVGGAIGHGFLQVMKDLGLKEPYVSQVQLQTGEIGDDITYYFAASEQVPSAVGLGVLMNKENTVRQAGGFIVQLMPFATEEVISKLEKAVSEVASVTELLEEGLSPEGILERLLGDLDLQITDNVQTQFACNCSKERFEKGLTSLPTADIQEMIADGEDIEVKCHFCRKGYAFSVAELETILARSR